VTPRSAQSGAPAPRVLGLVPARAGSRGVPGKNLRPLGGRPLLAYTADVALAARRLARVVLSTEDDAIAAAGRALGLEVPFRRPPELAADDTPMRAVMRHALAALEAAGDRYDAVCLLQPTVPFRTAALVDACVDALASAAAVDAVVTVRRVPDRYHPAWVYLPCGDGLLALADGGAAPVPRRQELPPAYHRDGAVYVIRRDAIVDGPTFLARRVLGYPTDGAGAAGDAAVNIDGPDDWALAEAVLARRGGRAAGAA
jgi:CMP-N,N'-diacetyllegionaminic acid synthase